MSKYFSWSRLESWGRGRGGEGAGVCKWAQQSGRQVACQRARKHCQQCMQPVLLAHCPREKSELSMQSSCACLWPHPALRPIAGKPRVGL